MNKSNKYRIQQPSSNNILAIKSSADQTVATTKLPKTGIKTIIILLVIVICAGIGAFIKYKKLNKYVKIE